MSTTRSRRASTTAGESSGAPGGKVSSMMQEEGRRIEEKQKRGNMPFRFWLPDPAGAKNPLDSEAEVIILDDSLESGFVRFEHNIQGSDGKWNNHEGCLKDTSDGPCPVCAKHGDSYLALYLTVIVNKPYMSSKTKEMVPFSRKLLVLKRGQYNTFADIEKIVLKQKGTLRGTVLVLVRDPGAKSFNTGMPAILDNGSMFDHMTEEELIAEFGNDAEISRDRKVLKEENADLEVFDYEALFPPPDPEDLNKRFGGGQATSGSRDHSRRTRAEDSDNIDTTPSRGRRGVSEPAPAAPTRSRRGGAAPVEEPAPSAPTRSRRSAAAPEAAPTAVRSRRAAAPPEVPGVEDDGEPEFED